jgi:murein endopeptidase
MVGLSPTARWREQASGLPRSAARRWRRLIAWQGLWAALLCSGGGWFWADVGRATPPMTAGAAAQGAVPAAEGARGLPEEDLPLVPIPDTGKSIGAPGRGRLRRAVQLPPNDALYTRLRPDHAWGSTFAISNLQLAIAMFRRDTGYAGPLVVTDISRRRGGRFRPHGSHQSGRDVDLWLPLAKPDATPEDVPARIEDVDWPAAWGLVQALIATDAVEYIFLDRTRQRQLHRIAESLGTPAEVLEAVLQYPRRTRTALVRHEVGHTRHMHIRFRCGQDEPRCR